MITPNIDKWHIPCPRSYSNFLLWCISTWWMPIRANSTYWFRSYSRILTQAPFAQYLDWRVCVFGQFNIWRGRWSQFSERQRFFAELKNAWLQPWSCSYWAVFWWFIWSVCVIPQTKLWHKCNSPPCIFSDKESIFNAILFFTEIHLFVRYVEKKLIITQETFITSVVSTIAVTLASLP